VEATKLVFRKGDIIFGRRRAYQRKLAVADFDGICSAHAMVLRARPEVILPEFLPFFMQSDLFMERALAISVGSLSPTINWKTLAQQEFVLPSLEEQRRRVELLSAAQALVESRFDAHAFALLTRRALQKRLFVESPEGAECDIGSVAEVRNGSTPSRGRADYWGGDIPWLPTRKVNDRFIRTADEFITDKALRECPISIIPAGATLVAMIGEGQTRGKAAFLEIASCINQNFGAVVPSDRIDGRYLFYCLESHYEALRNWSHGTNQHALNCGLIRSFRICLPSLERQRALATMILAADNGVTAANEQLQQSQKLLVEVRGFGAGPKGP
jgi:type I restriction enzyme S subunit